MLKVTSNYKVTDKSCKEFNDDLLLAKQREREREKWGGERESSIINTSRHFTRSNLLITCSKGTQIT